VAMGAQVIEKHFTMDRNLLGPDHKASLEPDELVSMVHQIRQIEASLGDGVKAPRSSELPVRDLVRRSVTLVKDKNSGEVIEEQDVVLLRPGTGIPPKYLQEIIGRQLISDLFVGTQLSRSDLN
jgi:N,N'-diacetyllegionaminate synthase